MSDESPDVRPPPAAGRETTPEHPATFQDVFAVAEFRSIYIAGSLSWVGDYLARAAITVLVYQQTSSVLLSAVSFAVSYLPWVVGGPVLAALAERYPYRRVMIFCDLLRMVLIGLLLVPGLPIPAMLALVFLGALANPPAQAAQSALLPLLLTRDRLVVGLAVNSSTHQAAQVVGYLLGATLAAAVDPRLALALDALTFALSALLISRGVRPRPSASNPAQRTHLLRETAEGFGLVFGSPVLRWVAIMVFSVILFAIVPEGLAAAWSGEIAASGPARGIAQGLIMAASPVGFILGGLLIGRFVAPTRRRALIRPLAVLTPLALVPALVAPSAPVAAAMAMATGFAAAGLLPTLSGLFVLALPHGFRARAFGVMQGGMQLSQGGAVLCTGLLAEQFPVSQVVGLWGAGGTVLLTYVALRWPSVEAFNAVIAAADPPPADPMPADPMPADPMPADPMPADPLPAVDDPLVGKATGVTLQPEAEALSPPPRAGRMER